MSLLMALALVLGTAPAALAAAKPVLCCEITASASEAELYLQDLDGSDIYGVQIEMTLDGEYSDCEFTPDSGTAYAPECSVEVRRNKTYVTLYLTDREPLNDEESLYLGTLYTQAAADAALPDTVKITLLDKNLRPMTGNMSGSISTDVFVLKEDKPNTKPGSPVTPTNPTTPTTPQLPGTDVVLPFTDVRTGDWFYDAVGYVYGRGMMQGMTAASFSPYASTDRAMIVTILHRLEGSPAAAASGFSDVAAGAYYAAPVAWASANGIVTGYEDGTFKPSAPITREQLAAILYRYAQYKGLDTSARGSYTGFPDGSKISAYAANAMTWALGAGLINGSDGRLLPQGTANRAQVAVILQRLCSGLMGLS